MNGVLGHLCAHIGQTVSEEPPGDSAINDMSLPSRHRIRGLAFWGGARHLSVTEAPHIIESLRVSGEETFWKLCLTTSKYNFNE